MSCTCTRCPDCEGTGHFYVSMGGEYLGQHRLDDLDELESCDQCGGSGIDSLCEECWEAQQEEDEREYQREHDRY